MPTWRTLQLKQRKLQLSKSFLQYLELLKQQKGSIHKVKRRYCVHPINYRNSLEGTWGTHLNLCHDPFPDKYKHVLRMNSDSFKKLLSIVENFIAKKTLVLQKKYSCWTENVFGHYFICQQVTLLGQYPFHLNLCLKPVKQYRKI